MAISANSVLEVRTTGSDTNGGGFVTGSSGQDMSVFDNKNTSGGSNCFSTTTDLSVGDAGATGSSTITSITANFSTNIIGNLVYISGGSGSIAGQWRQVMTRPNSTTITLDASIASSINMTLNIGGALLSPAIAASIASVAGNVVYIKYNASAYSITSASTNIAGGCVSVTGQKFYIGYDTNRTLTNTDSNRPTLQASGISTATIIAGGANANIAFRNIIVDGASLTSVVGFSTGGNNQATRCKALNCTNGAFTGGTAVQCEATGCATVIPFNGTARCVACVSHDNTVAGFSAIVAIGCLSYNNTGGSSHGFTGGGGGSDIFHEQCTAYNNGGSGFFGNAVRTYSIGCLAENNTGFGFNGVIALSCGTYNNTGGTFNTTALTAGASENNVTNTTGSFFVNAASGNFALNNTANQGALARATDNNMNVFPLGLTTGFIDIGAAQHADPTPPIGRVAVVQAFGSF